ncbi:MAG: cytochrome c biogenesis protein ResB [Nitrospirae bacterium]|nr:cytochrome c biogenesis protein ResB [Nitrospirota bacterium]
MATPKLGWEEISAELAGFFASIKLAMFLFIVLAMTATIGTVIQQGERPDVYIKEYGEEAYRWFLRLGFTDVYHTWWFTSLLALLCINSLTCFYKRFPAIWRSMMQDKVNVALPFITSMKHNAEIRVAGTKERVAEGMVHMLAEKGYRVLVKNDPQEVTLYATKGIMGRVGAHMAHLSATVIVLGGLIGSYWGFQEFGVCLEGQTYHIPKGNFDLRIDKFWIDYHDNGAVKSYNSTLTVIDHDRPMTTKTITVNDPLVYKGIWFYQSSYGDAWDRVEVARINIKEKETDRVLKTVDLEWQKEVTVDHLGLKLALTDFVADFSFNSSEKKVYSKSVEHANPAVRLAIQERKTLRATPWIFYHYPDLFDIQGSRYRFELVGYQPMKFTGLQINKDPGVNIVWVGSTMIVVGITLSSFIYHRRLWAKVIPHDAGATVHLGGNSHKSQIDFQKEFRKLTERIKTINT